jgi:hypothetical protein
MFVLLLSCGSEEQKEIITNDNMQNSTESPEITPEEVSNIDLSPLNLSLSEISASNIKISTNTYTSLQITIANNKDRNIIVSIPAGLIFDNLEESQQDLINLNTLKLYVSSNSTESISLTTACLIPGNSMPNSTNWNILTETPDKFSLVEGTPAWFEKYKTKLIWIDGLRKEKIFTTNQEQQHFQQMVIWLLLDTDKSTMINFMSEYVYDGNRRKSKSFVDKYYDGSKDITEIYKDYKLTGIVNWNSIIKKLKETKVPTKKEVKDKYNKLKGEIKL